MKKTISRALSAVALCGLILAGCSSSEEAAKNTTPPPAAGDMTKTDQTPVTVPDTPAPPDVKKTELPPTEKNVPEQQIPADPRAQAPDVTPPPAQKTGMMMWSVQVGAFKVESGADKTVNEAKAKFNNYAVYKDFDAVTGFYKVTVGSFQTHDQATKFKEEVRAQGYKEAFVVEVRR